MKDKVEILELWIPAEEGEAYDVGKNQPLSCIARIANGHPFYLAEGVRMERSFISKEHYKNLASK